jgi:hypothetical protein
VAGTPRSCRDRLEAYVKAGLQEIVLSLTGPIEHRGLALALAAEFMH